MGLILLKEELESIGNQHILLTNEINEQITQIKEVEEKIKQLEKSTLKDLESCKKYVITTLRQDITSSSKVMASQNKQDVAVLKEMVEDNKRAITVTHGKIFEALKQFDERVAVQEQQSGDNQRFIIEELKQQKSILKHIEATVFKKIEEEEEKLKEVLLERIDQCEKNQCNELLKFKKLWWKRFWIGWVVFIILWVMIMGL